MDLIYAPRHLCKRFGIDKIKATTRGIPGGKQVIIFANTNNRGGIYLFSHERGDDFSVAKCTRPGS